MPQFAEIVIDVDRVGGGDSRHAFRLFDALSIEGVAKQKRGSGRVHEHEVGIDLREDDGVGIEHRVHDAELDGHEHDSEGDARGEQREPHPIVGEVLPG